MRKSKSFLLIIFCSLFIFIFFQKFLISKENDTELENFNNKVYSRLKEKKSENPLCILGKNIYVLDASDNQYSEKNLSKFNFQYETYQSADYILPLKACACLFLLQSHIIKITDFEKAYLCEINYPESIWAMTYPVKENYGASFYILVWNANSKKMSLKKAVFENKEISLNFISDLELPIDFYGNMGFVETAFFDVKKEVVYLALGKLYAFSLNGKLIGEFGDADLIVPNVYDESIWYLSRIGENDEAVCSEYNLMKDGAVVEKISFPLLRGNFISAEKINFFALDSVKAENFDFINGPWQPVEISYLYNIATKEFSENYFKQPWKKGGFLTRGKIKNFSYVIIE